MRFSLAEITALTGAVVVRWPGSADSILPTSQQAAVGTGSLWFAMRPLSLTPDQLAALARAGAAGVMLFSGEPEPPADTYPQLGVLRAPSPALAFYRVAQECRNRSPGLVAGITGSAGKSSTKEFLAAILRSRYQVRATEASLNRISDCAENLASLGGAPDEAAVIEMGFGRIGDIEQMAAMARPRVGIVTKVVPDHLDGANGSWERVAYEKGRLGYHVPPDGVIVIHGEDPGCALLPRHDYRAPVLTFGTGPGLDATYTDVASGEAGTSFTLTLGGRSLPCRLNVYGAVQAANATAAALAAHALGLPENEILAGLQQVRPLPRRFQIHRFDPGLTVIDDTFSANVDAMERGLSDAAALAGERRKLALLSGIAGLDRQSAELHRGIGRHVAACGYQELFLLRPDDRTAAIREGAVSAGLAPERIHALPEVQGVARTLLPHMEPNTLLYAKTSQYLWVGPQIDLLLAAIPGRGWAPIGRPAGMY